MNGFTARLTPAFDCDSRGSVHSVFRNAVNLSFVINQRQRLLTLVPVDGPKLPDSVCVPVRLLQSLRIGEPVALENGALLLRGQRYSLCYDTRWDGKAHKRNGVMQAAAFLRKSADIVCGLDSLPFPIRQQADAALLSGDLQACLGLGQGLTPSFDDACVGAMAICLSTGAQMPHFRDTAVTTDISARYLRLASEGYFSQPVLDVIDAIYGVKPVAPALRSLLSVGSSSGSDTLYGICIKLREQRVPRADIRSAV